MIEVRFHGRGGQGAKIASRILGTSGFLAGLYAQDFALFGAERRGAPVISCARLGSQPIGIRGYIEAPNLVIVMDRSLLREAGDQVFHGVNPATSVFINGTADNSLALSPQALARLISVDLTGVCRRVVGKPFISAAAAAIAVKSIDSISSEALAEAVRIEFTEFGMEQSLIEKNQAAAREIYAIAPKTALTPSSPEPMPLGIALEAKPRITDCRLMSSAIGAGANAALRQTGSWRTERPEIERAKCKRCFLCYLYCAEAAIRLDRDSYPSVDYDHCKGCLVCRAECPAGAIELHVEG